MRGFLTTPNPPFRIYFKRVQTTFGGRATTMIRQFECVCVCVWGGGGWQAPPPALGFASINPWLFCKQNNSRICIKQLHIESCLI